LPRDVFVVLGYPLRVPRNTSADFIAVKVILGTGKHRASGPSDYAAESLWSPR